MGFKSRKKLSNRPVKKRLLFIPNYESAPTERGATYIGERFDDELIMEDFFDIYDRKSLYYINFDDVDLDYVVDSIEDELVIYGHSNDNNSRSRR